MVRVSVVVPTFERATRLPGLIKALEAQTLPAGEFDVVMADDASRDDTPDVLGELVARSALKMRVVRSGRNRGPAAARNLAWRASAAPVIAFTDDDCLPTPGWLAAGLARLDDTSAGIVQGRTIPDPTTPPRRGAVMQHLERFTNRYETCNIFYRTEVLHAVGGFDESMPFFGEDTVLGWTARRKGVASAFAAGAVVHHEVSYPGVLSHLRRDRLHGEIAATLVRRFPEMRREALWLGVFTKRRHAALIGAVAGVAVGVIWRPALLFAIPYAWYQRPRSRREIVDRLLLTTFDAARVSGLLIGSARERTLVL